MRPVWRSSPSPAVRTPSVHAASRPFRRHFGVEISGCHRSRYAETSARCSRSAKTHVSAYRRVPHFGLRPTCVFVRTVLDPATLTHTLAVGQSVAPSYSIVPTPSGPPASRSFRQLSGVRGSPGAAVWVRPTCGTVPRVDDPDASDSPRTAHEAYLKFGIQRARWPAVDCVVRAARS